MKITPFETIDNAAELLPNLLTSYLLIYGRTYLLSYLRTYLPAAYLWDDLPAILSAYLPAILQYLLTYLLTYLLRHLLTILLTGLPLIPLLYGIDLCPPPPHPYCFDLYLLASVGRSDVGCS